MITIRRRAGERAVWSTGLGFMSGLRGLGVRSGLRAMACWCGILWLGHPIATAQDGPDRGKPAGDLATRDDGVGGDGPGATIPAKPRLPRDRLLLSHADADQGGRTPEQHWRARRETILDGMRLVMGRLPGEEKRCELDVTVIEEVDCGSYLRQRIHYTSEPGCRTPAYLCIPKWLMRSPGSRARGVLCLHGTDQQTGHGTVVGIGRPDRQYAAELAERGFVTIAPSYPLMANYQPDVLGLGWESGTLKAVWDNMRALDVLASRGDVHGDRFAAIGHSLGGHNAVFTAVWDPRIRAVVTSCGLDSFLDYYDGDENHWMPERGWCQTRYMPKLARYRGRLEQIPFDFHELIGALAPRRVLIIAPTGDGNFRADSVDRVATAARQVFELFGAPDDLRVIHPEIGHDFPADMRAEAYRFLEASFPDAIPDPDGSPDPDSSPEPDGSFNADGPLNP